MPPKSIDDYEAVVEKLCDSNWTTAPKGDLEAFTEAKARLYAHGDRYQCDEFLWHEYQDDFKTVTIDTLKQVSIRVLKILRTALRCGGVYVAQNKAGLTVAQTLFDLISEPERHKWITADIEDVNIKGDLEIGPVTSIQLFNLDGGRSTWTLAPYLTGRKPSIQGGERRIEDRTPASNVPSNVTTPGRESYTVQDARAGEQLRHQPPAQMPAQMPFQGPIQMPVSNRGRSIEPNYHQDHQLDEKTTKLVLEVGKNVPESMKYDGSNGSFDAKYEAFLGLCQRVNLPEHALLRALPALLKGLVLNHWNRNKLGNGTLEHAKINIRRTFEGVAYQTRNLLHWNQVNLAYIGSKHPEKSTIEQLRILADTLAELQYGLAPSLQHEDILHQKLLTACYTSPACQSALVDPPATYGDLLNKLQSSILAYENGRRLGPETFATGTNDGIQTPESYYGNDRVFNSNNRSRYGDSRGSYGGSYGGRNWRGRGNGYRGRGGYRQSNSRYSTLGEPKRCYICKDLNCRSWRHEPHEIAEYRAGLKAEKYRRFGAGNSKFDTQFQQFFEQYTAEVEGNDDPEEDQFDDVFLTTTIEGDVDSHQQLTIPTSSGAEETYWTSYGELSSESASLITQILSNQAYMHLESSSTLATRDTELETPDTLDAFSTGTTPRYGPGTPFYGLIVDTGAAEHSTAGIYQFEALQKLTNVELDVSTKGSVKVQFGIGSADSLGSATIPTPIGTIVFHIMPANIPFLLSLRDMDEHQMLFNNLTNTLETPKGKFKVIRRFGHAFYLWNTALEAFLTRSIDQYPCSLTDVELQRLHRRFGHPSVDRLQKVLERADYEFDLRALDELTKRCEQCQKHAHSPHRFKFSIRDDVSFNYSILIDTFWIDSKPVLHVIDEATRYQAGRWLRDGTSKTIWDTLRLCWIDTYLGPPDQITADAGKNYAGDEFKQLANSVGTKVKIVPVEAHHSIGLVERYHGPIRRAYETITAEIRDIDNDMALQMAFKAVNDTAGPNGLIPTLLVYGAFPRMCERDSPSPTMSKRAEAINKAMDEVAKYRAKRQVADALNTRNGPNTTAIHDLKLGDEVIVWREKGTWEGPFKLVRIEGENCIVQMTPKRQATFRTTSVRPFLRPEQAEIDPKGDIIVVQMPDAEPNFDPGSNLDVGTGRSNFEPGSNLPILAPIPVKRGRGRPRKVRPDVTAYIQDPIEQFDTDEIDQWLFEKSRIKEVTGLIERGVFKVPSTIPEYARIFNSRFVDELKNAGTGKEIEKSRLVVQAYHDDDKHSILTQSPTIQRVSQRILLCLAVVMISTGRITGKQFVVLIRDITQAYTQATSELIRDIFVRAPPELLKALNLPDGTILQVVRPLYGVPEAGNHWFKTYHSHHRIELDMEQSTFDPCLLTSSEPFGIVGLQTDDTLMVCDLEFAQKEEAKRAKAGFTAKDREQLTPENDLKFNGCGIRLGTDDCISITQERQCQNLKLVKFDTTDSTSSRGVTRPELTTKEQYVAQRARGAYIATVCQPEACYDLSVAAQATEIEKSEVDALNKRIQWQIENAARGLRYVPLDLNSLQLLVFTDASFANNKDLSSQMGYVIALTDASGSANILHWSSTKCKRVTRSVLASELYGMAHGFDMGVSIKGTIEKALKIDLPLVICTDSRSLYDCIVKLGTTQEKRLMIDVMCLREAYERRDIAEVRWIKGSTNPADSMTKAKASNALKQLIDTNKLQIDVQEWVERPATAKTGDVTAGIKGVKFAERTEKQTDI